MKTDYISNLLKKDFVKEIVSDIILTRAYFNYKKVYKNITIESKYVYNTNYESFTYYIYIVNKDLNTKIEIRNSKSQNQFGIEIIDLLSRDRIYLSASESNILNKEEFKRIKSQHMIDSFNWLLSFWIVTRIAVDKCIETNYPKYKVINKLDCFLQPNLIEELNQKKS